MSSERLSEPSPLEDEDDGFRALLRQADAESRLGFDEAAAFERVERARRRRIPRRLQVQLVAFAALGAIVIGVRHHRAEEAVPIADIRAESIAPPRASVPAPSPSEDEAGRRKVEPRPAPINPAPQQRKIRKPSRVAHSVASEPPINAPPPELEAPSEERCRALETAGQLDSAVHCFRGLATGGGLDGDIALYEAARLSFRVAGGAALELVEEHQRRFPASALRVEVEWLRIRSLRAARRADEALAASERLLASRQGAPLASEIHRFRASIYADDRKDCASALSDWVALMNESGERGDDAEWRRASCFEQLGRTLDAVAAYEHYLSRHPARHGDTARQRLTALRSSKPEGP